MMFRLTREVRFAVNPGGDDGQLAAGASNSYGGFPSMVGLGHYFELSVSLVGEVGESGYLRNIKEIDGRVRAKAVPMVGDLVRAGGLGPATVVAMAYAKLKDEWPGARVDGVRLAVTPRMAYEVKAEEFPMTRLSQKFEFSASHRLHNPALSEDENRRCYGKCNNPYGHGHNYEVQVTVAGTPDPGTGVLVDVPAFERVVGETVIARFDHKNLNVEVDEFAEMIPSVENIARVIYGLLKPKLEGGRVRLAGVTVWETPKTWCEYSEG